jgi:hypothetical protein
MFTLREDIFRSYTSEDSVSPCAAAWFSPFQNILPKIDIASPSYATCSMMYDAYAMQNDEMMFCLCEMIFILEIDTHSHDETRKFFFKISVDFSL